MSRIVAHILKYKIRRFMNVSRMYRVEKELVYLGIRHVIINSKYEKTIIIPE